ncbi:MAG: glycosyltransferase [Clostridia bacterium]|nr:glycosyltransferase [Clostridia bacterium]
MRIVVNDIAASSGGALSVLTDFYEFVKENYKNDEWIFLLGDKYIEETENIKVVLLPEIKESHKKKLIFDFFTGRKVINDLNPDAVISLQNIITFGVKVPQLVFIHQALPFQDVRKFSLFKASERSLAIVQHIIGAIIKISAKCADVVAVQTNWMRRAVAKKANVRIKKVVVCPPEISIEKGTAIPDTKSFFYPTGKSIYKNNDCIFEAVNILKEEGINDFKIKLTLDEENDENFEFTGRLSREAVVEEYKKSVLLFPSYIESFGYPLAEAGRTGTIILSSDTPVARDALGDYENAYYFDPFEPCQLADLMKQVINGEIKQKETEYAEKETSGWPIMISALQEMV